MMAVGAASSGAPLAAASVATSARSVALSTLDTSLGATFSANGVAVNENCKCVSMVTSPCLSGTVCESSRPGLSANSNRSNVASAYVFPGVPSSCIVCSTKSVGLRSYIPVLGLTNIDPARVSVSSHTASPRSTFATPVSALLDPRFQINFNLCVPGNTLYALCARTSN